MAVRRTITVSITARQDDLIRSYLHSGCHKEPVLAFDIVIARILG